MQGVRLSHCLVWLVVVLVGITQVNVWAQPINLDTTYVHWEDLDVQGDGLFGWDDATASADGVSFSDSDHFDDAMGVRVGGTAYGGNIALAIVNGLNITLPDQTIDGMTVHIEFQGSNTSPVMRQIIVIQNPTGSTYNSTVSWINNSGNDSGQVTVGTSSGDLIETIDDRWVVTADSTDVNQTGSETNMWVIYGPNDPVSKPTTVNMTEAESSFGTSGSEGLTAEIPISVPAGETRAIMFFVVATTTGTEALTLAPSFDDTDSALFQTLIADLSSQELAQLLNWFQLSTTSYEDLAMSFNQSRVGRVYDLVFNGAATGQALEIHNTLSGLSDDQKRQTMQQTIPQINMAVTGALLGTQQLISGILDGRATTQLKIAGLNRDYFNLNTNLAANSDAATGDAVEAMNQTASRDLNVWVQSINSFGDQDSDTNAAGYNWKSFGGAVGVDRMIKDNWLLGASLAGYNTNVDGADDSGDADIMGINISAYTGWSHGQTHVQGGMSFGFADIDATQPYPLLGLTARSDYQTYLFGSWISVGHVFSFEPKCPVKVEPVAGLEYLHIHDESYTQTDAGIMNQSIGAQNTDSLIAKLGANFLYDLQLAGKDQLQLVVGSFWRHELLDDNVDTQGKLAGNSFNAQGVDRDRDAWEVTGGMAWQFSDNMVFNCNYAGQFASNWDNHMVKLGLLIQF